MCSDKLFRETRVIDIINRLYEDKSSKWELTGQKKELVKLI